MLSKVLSVYRIREVNLVDIKKLQRVDRTFLLGNILQTMRMVGYNNPETGRE